MSDILNFPALTLIRFCHNHSLLQIFDRPQWLTISNGRLIFTFNYPPSNGTKANRTSASSHEYIKAIQDHISEIRSSCGVVSVTRMENGKVKVIDSKGGEEIFDHVVFGSLHSFSSSLSLSFVIINFLQNGFPTKLAMGIRH